MKRKILALSVMAVSCLWTGVLAQTFNRIYLKSTQRMMASNVALMTNPDKDLVFVAYGGDTIFNSLGNNRSLIIKTDSSGNVLQTLQADTTNATETVIETHDHGVLYIAEFLERLEVIKYDNTLAQMWAASFPHDGVPYLGSTGYSYIDAERVFDPTAPPGMQESYYIFYSVGSPDPMYVQNDFNLAVLKLDESGSLVWHKIYQDMNRPNYGSTAVRDFAYSITSYYSPSHQRRVLALAGNRKIYFPYNDHQLFTFLIDEDGNMVSSFNTIATGDYEPWGGSIAWDGDSLVMTYLEENGSINPIPDQVAGTGLIKFDENFNTFRGKYYWFECENGGMEITVAPDGNYIISGASGACQAFQSPFMPSMALQKIERNSLDEIFYYRYDVDRQSTSGFHRTDSNGFNYQIGFTHIDFANGSFENVQLIKTDPMGMACGATALMTENLDFTPSPTAENYFYDDLNEMQMLEPFRYPITLEEILCKGGGHGGDDGSVPRTSPSSVGSKLTDDIAVEVMPTLMAPGQQELKLRVIASGPARLTVKVYNHLGQLMTERYFTAQAGTGSFTIDANELSSGMNFVRVYNHEKLIQTSKVVVLSH